MTGIIIQLPVDKPRVRLYAVTAPYNRAELHHNRGHRL